MSKIIWKDIPGYENNYKISSAGEVKMLPRKIFDKDGTFLKELEETEIEVRRPKGDRPYVILHNGQKYIKEDLEELMNTVFA